MHNSICPPEMAVKSLKLWSFPETWERVSSVVRALDSWLNGHRFKPCRSSGRIFFSRVNFLLCWPLFWYLFHACVTAVACKRSWSFCQMCRWQVTSKHTCTLRMWLCMKQHDAWSYGVCRTLRDGSNFTWHQPCQHCKYPTLVDIQKRATRKLVTHVKSHMSAASLLEWRTVPCKSDKKKRGAETHHQQQPERRKYTTFRADSSVTWCFAPS